MLFPGECETDPFFLEREVYRAGFSRIAGIDEAGRGPLAGPVVAAAVILPGECMIPRLTDSKKLSPSLRDQLFPLIQKKAVAWGIGICDAGLIDRINILEATRCAMKKAVEALQPAPDYLLIDAVRIQDPTPQKGIIKGDLLSHSIAAASVIAKVTRDRLMAGFHQRYPEYNFQKHKGYGTLEHRKILQERGPCPIHRKTFRGVREYCSGTMQEGNRISFLR
ncbi:MAG: ribonuclease HII [Deltaproteobacteria bacterium]|nr:ribonuclease HII [Deltaproteobacteria bacterium]